MELPGPDQSVAVPLQDLRPAKEKENEIFSLLVTSSQYGIYRKGDVTLEPPMTQIFRRLAYEKVGGGGNNVSIKVHHMVVYMNRQSELRRGAVMAVGGAVGGALAAGIASGKNVNLSQSLVDRNQFEASSNEEYKRALYSSAENPENASCFVIYIDAEVNGKRVFVKTLAPIQSKQEGQDPYALAVRSAINYYLSQI